MQLDLMIDWDVVIKIKQQPNEKMAKENKREIYGEWREKVENKKYNIYEYMPAHELERSLTAVHSYSYKHPSIWHLTPFNVLRI